MFLIFILMVYAFYVIFHPVNATISNPRIENIEYKVKKTIPMYLIRSGISLHSSIIRKYLFL
jgi:hypothetical protein